MERYDVVIVGAGFAGMYGLHKFRAQGLSVKVFEAGSDVGGTWYWNRYPGARCDVPSIEYSFGFSEELEQEWDWPEVFSAQPDILRYANHVADRFNLRKDIQFESRVTEVLFLEESSDWRISVGETYQCHAKFCVMATGCLSVPNTPEIEGADQFRGQVLHTGRWPKEEVDLSGKRVGVIGTGSSGVQAIPELAKMSGHLYVYQRSPVYTVPANRKAMREEVQQEFRKNYREIRRLQQHNFGGVSNFRLTESVRRPQADRANRKDAASAMPAKILGLSEEARKQLIAEQGLGVLLSFADVYSDLEANEVANRLFREEIAQIVDDQNVAAGLLPNDYGLGCKRQVLDRDYYETFNRSDVSLVNLKETPLERITPNGIKTSDAEQELDVLIYATGFDAMTGALLKSNVVGKNGVALQDKWQFGPAAYLGLQISGFPNLFMVTGPGSPSVLCNMLVAIEQHINWISDCISYMEGNGLSQIEPTEQAEEQWVVQVNQVAEGTMYTAPTCNSWYLGANIPGKPRIFMPYVGGYPQYKARCDEIVANGYEGFSLS